MTHMPLVSVVVPVYNYDQYIGECIESVLTQTYSNWGTRGRQQLQHRPLRRHRRAVRAEGSSYPRSPQHGVRRHVSEPQHRVSPDRSGQRVLQDAVRRRLDVPGVPGADGRGWLKRIPLLASSGRIGSTG